MKGNDHTREPDWDEEDEDPSRPGPKPERLKSEETAEELARRVMRAGKPKPGEIEEEDEEG